MGVNNVGGIPPTSNLYWAGIIFLSFGIPIFFMIQFLYYFFIVEFMKKYGAQVSEISLTTFVKDMNLGLKP